VTLLLLAASVFAVSSKKNHSTISQPCLVLKPYLPLVHGLNSLLVWFQHWAWSADGAVCDDITPCLIGAKKVGLMGAIFTSPKHLLALPQKKSIIHMHRLDVMSRQVRHGHHIGRCLCSSGRDVSAIR
jgi:hypothetical protein